MSSRIAVASTAAARSLSRRAMATGLSSLRRQNKSPTDTYRICSRFYHSRQMGKQQYDGQYQFERYPGQREMDTRHWLLDPGTHALFGFCGVGLLGIMASPSDSGPF